LNTRYPKQNYLLLLLSLLLFFIAIFFERKITWQASDYQSLTLQGQQALAGEEALAKIFIDSLTKKIDPTDNLNWEKTNTLADKVKKPPEGFAFFLYKNNSLIYWSDNNVLYEPSPTPLKDQQLVFMANGWYEYFNRKKGNYDLHGLLLIRHQYAFQNKYLNNGFNPSLHLPEYSSLEVDKNKAGWAVHNSKGEFLFGVNYSNDPVSPDSEIPLMIVFFSAIAILLLFLYSFGKYLVTVKPAYAFLMIGLVLLIRLYCLL
jgi:hypothetical protein